jgi:protoheme IX farnesyltransferase
LSKAYYHLTKPGIVYGNLLPALASYIYGASSINWVEFLAMLLGLACVIASAGVFNNYYDRDIDARMTRTKGRAFAAGTINRTHALIFGTMLIATGCMLLYFFTNTLALAAAVFGWAVYIFAYTPLKHIHSSALFVGAIAGAMPPVVGYVAATNTLNTTVWWLFGFLFVWQIPHFIAIALYRYDEYAAAGVPLIVSRPKTERTRKIARIVFYASLVVLLLWCLALTLQR